MFSIADCIPDPSNLDSDPDMPKTVNKLKKTLTEAETDSNKRPPPNYDLVPSKVTLQALGINIGDKVMVSGVKVSGNNYGWFVYCLLTVLGFFLVRYV